MKKSFIFIGFSIAFISTLLLVEYKNQQIRANKIVHLNEPSPRLIKAESIPYQEDIEYDVNMINPKRASITFIMNNSHEVGNGLIEAAEKHYRLNPTSEQETIVNQCGSILNIIDYLTTNETYNGEPWGKINIVQYSEDWKGMNILTEEERNTSEEIFNAMEEHSFNPLDDDIVDAETEIMVDGTGIGNNEPLLEIIALAFGGHDEERPTIRSSKFISTFHATENESRKYITESFFGFFPVSDALTDDVIISQFEKNYPEEEMDWFEVINRPAPRFVGDAYTSFNYEDDLQTVSILRAMTIQNEDDLSSPLPFEADLNDSRFFTTITATPKNSVLSLNEF